MITESSMYWITRLDHILETLQIFDLLIFLTFIIAIITALMTSVLYLDEGVAAKARNISLKIAFAVLLPLCFVLSAACVFVPSTKEYCAIKVVPAIVNSEKIQNLGNEFYKLGLEWIKDLGPKSEVENEKTDES